MEEVWKDIPGYETFYMVSNVGRVKALDRNVWNGKVYTLRPEKIKSPQKTKNGYLVTDLFDGYGQRKTCYIHRMIAYAFLGVQKELDVNHIDGDRQNNCLENLEWVDRKANIQHSIKINVAKHGKVLRQNRKLTQEIVLEIRAKHKETGFGKTNLHKNFFPTISPSVIDDIIKNRTWKSIEELQ